MNMLVDRLPAFNDNYLWALRAGPDARLATVVDPGDANVIEDWLARTGCTLEAILVTHHHDDHIGGVAALKARHACRVIGPAFESRLTGVLEEFVSEGDAVSVAAGSARVIEVHGHTSSHIAYWFDSEQALFCGDSLFVLGCGRMFEGNPQQMWGSLKKMRDLPDATRIYCAHEYSQSNARFALAVDPHNIALQEASENINRLRARGEPTVPGLMGDEKRTNPFLRADLVAPLAYPELANAPEAERFAALRRAKDTF